MKPKLITYFSHRRVTNPINSAKSSVINPSCWGVGQQRDQSLDTCSTGEKYHHFFHPPTDPTNPSSFLQVGRRPLSKIDPLHSIRDSGALSETRAFSFWARVRRIWLRSVSRPLRPLGLSSSRSKWTHTSWIPERSMVESLARTFRNRVDKSSIMRQNDRGILCGLI